MGFRKIVSEGVNWIVLALIMNLQFHNSRFSLPADKFSVLFSYNLFSLITPLMSISTFNIFLSYLIILSLLCRLHIIACLKISIFFCTL